MGKGMTGYPLEIRVIEIMGRGVCPLGLKVGDCFASDKDLAQACQGVETTHCSADDATRLRNLSAAAKTLSAQTTSPTPLERIWSVARFICPVLLDLLIVVGGGFIAYRWWRGRQEEREVRESIAERVRTVEPVAAWGVEGSPLAQFPTTYALGDDHFDPG